MKKLICTACAMMLLSAGLFDTCSAMDAYTTSTAKFNADG